jgi:hypothetical protein
MDLVLDLQQKHLSPLDAFNFDFLLVSVLEVQGRDILELEFLCHVCACRIKGSTL